MTRLFAGKVGAAPVEVVSAAAGWNHVAVPSEQEFRPIRVAIDPATLEAGGGDTIYPGGCIDIYAERVWARGPRVGGDVSLWVERRQRPSRPTQDPMGMLRSTLSNKAAVFELEPEKWRMCLSNVHGLWAYYARAEGGPVWIGTHLDVSKPPYGPNTETGVGWQLQPNDPPLFLPGNPGGLWAWAEQPNCRLRILKISRGWNW